MEALKALVDCGKIRHWGLSNENAHGINEFRAAAAAAGLAPPCIVQNAYSLLQRADETTDVMGTLPRPAALCAPPPCTPALHPRPAAPPCTLTMAPLPCSPAHPALQPCVHPRPASQCAFHSLQPYVPSRLQPYVPSSLQPYVPSSLQPYVPSSLQPYVPSSLQPCVPSRRGPWRRCSDAADAADELRGLLAALRRRAHRHNARRPPLTPDPTPDPSPSPTNPEP